MAASMAFSVAPTLGMLRTISAPVRPGAVQFRLPPSSRMQAPKVRRADRCRSMGRAPMAQPPGYDSSAWPHRARMAPRNTTDERMRRMNGAAQVAQNGHGRVHVLQPRTALQNADVPAENTRCQNGQHTVFGTLYRQVAAQAASPFNNQAHMPPPFIAFSRYPMQGEGGGVTGGCS